MSGGGFLQGYMRIFGQEGIGRPDIDAENEMQALRRFFTKNIEGSNIPEIKSILVFTNDGVELEAGDSPIPAMKLKGLKEFLRQGSKNRLLSSGEIAEITELFPKE